MGFTLFPCTISPTWNSSRVALFGKICMLPEIHVFFPHRPNSTSQGLFQPEELVQENWSHLYRYHSPDPTCKNWGEPTIVTSDLICVLCMKTLLLYLTTFKFFIGSNSPFYSCILLKCTHTHISTLCFKYFISGNTHLYIFVFMVSQSSQSLIIHFCSKCV